MHLFYKFINVFFNAWQIESGLGESEAFYSWLLATLFTGSVIGSLLSGVLLKYVPYWHLILTSLLLHTVGYVLHATAKTGWVVMLSKLLSGTYIGADMTLSFTYICESIGKYQKALHELGEDDRKANGVKNRLFAFQAFGFNIGNLIGAGIYRYLSKKSFF